MHRDGEGPDLNRVENSLRQCEAAELFATADNGGVEEIVPR